MLKSTVIEALEKVRQRNPNKKLVPESVVRAASHDENPLHKYFTWDDGIAAKKHRLWEARQLIAEIDVIYDSPIETGPKYVSLDCDRKTGGGYREVRECLSNAALRADMLRTALGEFDRMRERYEKLKELSEVFIAIKKVRTAVPAGHPIR